MGKYLGEEIISINDNPLYKNYTQSDFAMLYISSYGQIDGDHHKLWILDQVSRILKGTPVILKIASWDNGHRELRFETGAPSEEYLKFVEEMKGSVDENGDCEYSYDEGIAP